jgi:hypothetical protein
MNKQPQFIDIKPHLLDMSLKCFIEYVYDE